MSERRQAEELARQIMRDSNELQWLQPLAREYLKAIDGGVMVPRDPIPALCGEQGRIP